MKKTKTQKQIQNIDELVPVMRKIKCKKWEKRLRKGFIKFNNNFFNSKLAMRHSTEEKISEYAIIQIIQFIKNLISEIRKVEKNYQNCEVKKIVKNNDLLFTGPVEAPEGNVANPGMTADMWDSCGKNNKTIELVPVVRKKKCKHDYTAIDVLRSKCKTCGKYFETNPYNGKTREVTKEYASHFPYKDKPTQPQEEWEKDYMELFGENHHAICEGKKCECHKVVKLFISNLISEIRKEERERIIGQIERRKHKKYQCECGNCEIIDKTLNEAIKIISRIN